ncbi:MAG: DUF3552 domain-containing protein, partial [Planctomycetes bacterium]|nr:DUF3552 domain-containing protein [Planctomycetota bacterium]
MILAETGDIVIGLLGGLIVGAGALGAAVFFVMKGKVEAARKSSSEDADRITEEAKKEAENILTAARLDGKNEALKLREKVEQDLDKDRREIKELEKRIAKREESIEQKFEMLDRKADQIEKRDQEITKTQAHV